MRSGTDDRIDMQNSPTAANISIVPNAETCSASSEDIHASALVLGRTSKTACIYILDMFCAVDLRLNKDITF